MKWLKTITIIATAAVAVSPAIIAPQPAAQNLNKVEVRQILRNAHSSSDFRALATYYRAEQARLQTKANAEKAEWERRENALSALSMKYPRPADSSRNRYQYFAYEADRMGAQAAYFESLMAEPR